MQCLMCTVNHFLLSAFYKVQKVPAVRKKVRLMYKFLATTEKSQCFFLDSLTKSID